MSDDDGEDVLSDLESELSPFVTETFDELLGASHDSGDYQRFVETLDPVDRETLRRIVKERPRRQTRAVPSRIRSSHHLAYRELGPLPEATR